jgi:glycerophosphoryl diester phosphodiesterase
LSAAASYPSLAMRPYLSHEHPLRFGHRGSNLLWPQNTMLAFSWALNLGLRYLETDVHATRDGRVVAFHDDRLDLLTNGAGKVWDRDWEDLRGLDAAYHFDAARGYPLRGTGVRLPLLEEVLATFPQCLLNLDLKQEGMEDLLAAEITRLGVEDRVLVGSFHDRRISRFRRAGGGRVATSAGPAEVLAAVGAARLGRSPRGPADAYQVPERLGPLRVVGKRFVEVAHAAGKQVHVWVVNDPAAMHRLLDLGVDGIVTDRADLLVAVVAERARR